MKRRHFLTATAAATALLAAPRLARAAGEAARLAPALDAARNLAQLHGLIIAQDGKALLAEPIRGPRLDQPVNIKSISKSVISALVGRAIGDGILPGPEAPVVALLEKRLPAEADPRLQRITLDHLLSMRAGLERTSGPNYGAWVKSRNWVRHILSRPFVEEPGGPMLYSTGSTHLLSAILTDATGRSTLELARAWLGEPLGIDIPAWERDPQGVYLGGNNMLLSPEGLLRFGEMYRQGGQFDGKRVLPADWVASSWRLRTTSRFTGHGYGYGWFIYELGGHPVYYAWGYGGQMIYIVPDLRLTVVVTSDPSAPSGRSGYADDLHTLVARHIIPALG
ncbi:serine hydrolase domain-containing protein [Dongia sp.]|uniref:serine hydrolase domain-containing protein n=1 Tax=Dongia sp. TaxID=1977262 RepID=UPI0035B2D75D